MPWYAVHERWNWLKNQTMAKSQLAEADTKSEVILSMLSLPSQETKFIFDAAKQLINNRNMLQNSYVILFCLRAKKKNQHR